MRFKRRFKLSEQQRNDMWRRWKAGQSLHEVGRAFGKAHGVIHFMLAQHGGIAPAVWRRSPLTRTLEERENISRGIAFGSSIREIAKGLWRAVFVDAISIQERPAEIEDPAVPGHWEGDLLGGTKNSHIATLVESHSRFVTLIKVPSKDTATVVAALTQHVCKLPAALRRSLTWDRGLEMAQHKSFTVDTEVKVYFCDPQSSAQASQRASTLHALIFPRSVQLEPRNASAHVSQFLRKQRACPFSSETRLS
jgi:IS30 family transposase